MSLMVAAQATMAVTINLINESHRSCNMTPHLPNNISIETDSTTNTQSFSLPLLEANGADTIHVPIEIRCGSKTTFVETAIFKRSSQSIDVDVHRPSANVYGHLHIKGRTRGDASNNTLNILFLDSNPFGEVLN